MQRFRLVAALAAVLSLSASLNCYAQATASINGTVTDPSGGVIPDALITAKEVQTGTTRTVTTGASGLYRFNDLQPGTYVITAEAKGFAKSEIQSVSLQVGDARDVNVSMLVATQANQVMVSEQADVIETT